MIDRHTMTTGDVARVAGLSVDRVKDLDNELQPIRLASGHRRYDPSVVERYVAARTGAPMPTADRRVLTDAEIERAVPDGCGPAHYVRGMREFLKAMVFAPGFDPVPAARAFVKAQMQAVAARGEAWNSGGEPQDPAAYKAAARDVARATKKLSEASVGRSRAKPATPTRSHSKQRSRARARRRGSSRTKASSNDSDDGPASPRASSPGGAR